MMRFITAFFFLIVLICQPLQAADVLEKRADIKLDGNGPWYQLSLDAKTQLLSNSVTLGDIRVLDVDGKEQPYAFYNDNVYNKQNDGMARYEDVQVDLYPLYSNSANASRPSNIIINKTGDNISISVTENQSEQDKDAPLQGYILDLKKSTHDDDTLEIDWEPKKDGFYAYRLEISDDMENWRLVESGELYRLTNEANNLNKSKITLKQTEGRFLRIRWLDETTSPILKEAKLNHAIMLGKPQAQVVWSDILQAKRVESEDKSSEIYEISFPTAHTFQTIKINLPEGYSLAPFTLYGTQSSSQSAWHKMQQGLFYQLLGKDGRVERLDSVELPQTDVSSIRIVIDKRGGGFDLDSLPIQVALPSNHYVFLARGNAPYHVEIGKSGQKSAELIFSDLVPDASDLSDSRISLATLVTPFSDVVVAPKEEIKPSFDWKKLTLWGVLVIGVAFLLLMAFQLLRQSDKEKK